MLEDVEAQLASLSGSLSALQGPLTDVNGRLRDAQGRFVAAGGGADGLSSSLAALGPEGAAAGMGLDVMGSAAQATVGALGSLMQEAIDVNEQLDLLRVRTAALAGSAQGGAAVQHMVERISATMPFATAQVQEWANALIVAGVKGKDLEMATKAVANAAAIMPSGGAEAATKLISKLSAGGKEGAAMLKQMQQGGRPANQMLRQMGLEMKDLGGQAKVAKMSADQLNKAVQAALIKKGKGPLDEMANSFPSIIEKAQEGFRSLFSGLGPAIKPFMAAVKALFGEFNKGGSATSSLKPIITGVFSALFGWATKAVKAVKSVMDSFIASGGAAATMDTLSGIWSGLVSAFETAKPIFAAVWAGIQAGISVVIAIFDAAKPMVMALWSQIKSGIGEIVTAFQPAVAAFKRLFAALGGGKTGASALSGVFRIVGAVLSVVVSAVVLFATTFASALTSVVDGATALVGGIQALPGEISSFVDGAIAAITGLPAAAMDAASNFISGLVGGISAGAGAVVDAVKGLASGALSAFTGALGIHSPSTIMLEHGEDNIAGAAATGIDRGAPKVAKASSRMADGAKPKGRGGARAGGSGEGRSITFTNCTFWGTTEDKIRELINKVDEELAGQAGAMGEVMS